MKLITLNLWGGRVTHKLGDFFKSNSADIWCFQEVFNANGDTGIVKNMIHVPGFEPNLELLTFIKKHLPSHTAYFCTTHLNSYGISIFISNKIKVLDVGEFQIAQGDWETNNDIETKDHDRKVQWIKLNSNGKEFFVLNGHLTHRPVGKEDSEKRLTQSKIIIDFLKQHPIPTILVGDFNLMPHTNSIKMIEDAGMTNLIKKYNITGTRTELYKKEWKFADYAFISAGIQAHDFKVMPDIVSDHSPLFLDFTIV